MATAATAAVAAAATGCHGLDHFPVLGPYHIDHADVERNRGHDAGRLAQGKFKMANGFTKRAGGHVQSDPVTHPLPCLLYTSDAADECVNV